MAQDKIPIPDLPSIGGGDSGSSEMASEFMRDLAGPAPAPASPSPPQPAAIAPIEPPGDPSKPADPIPPLRKPDAPTTPPARPVTPPAPVQPPKPAQINVDDPKLTAKDLRDHLKTVIQTTGQTVAQRQKQIDELQNKIKEFEGRKYWTEDDIKASETATQRLAKLEADLYGRDYRQSPEFKEKYQSKFDRLWNKGKETVKGLTVKFMEGEEQKERAATERDLLDVVDAPPSQRYKLAKQLFGDDHAVVTDYANKLNDIRDEAEEAVQDKQKSYQSETQKQAEELRAVGGQIEAFVKQASDGLVQQFPDIFAAKEDEPEVAAALKKGFDFVNESRMKQATMTVNERAARIATITAWAGAFPRLVHDLSKLRAEIASLREENGKYRKSDPGTMGEGGAEAAGGVKDGGSDDLAAEIDALNKK